MRRKALRVVETHWTSIHLKIALPTYLAVTDRDGTMYKLRGAMAPSNFFFFKILNSKYIFKILESNQRKIIFALLDFES